MWCRVLPVPVLLAICVAAAAEGPDEKLRESSRLAPHRLSKVPLIGYRLPDGVVIPEKPKARKAKVGRSSIVFVDTNGNDRFDDLGVDGWQLLNGETPYLFPLEEKLVIGTDEVAIRIEADELKYSREHIVSPPLVLKALVLLNGFRARNGLVPVALNRELSSAAEKHVSYMQRNGMTHRQEPGQFGYSEEGAAAGPACVLYAGGALAAVTWYWSTAFHRFPVAHPDTRSVGMATGRAFTATDGVRDRRSRGWRWPVIIPAPESTGHPTRFGALETPQSHPRSMAAGCPISLHFPDGSMVKNVKAELRRGGSERGKPVQILVSSPEKPVTEDLPGNDYSILLIPTKPLGTHKKYWARVTYDWRGKTETKEWTFTTR